MHQTIEKMNQLRLHQMAVIHHQRITENIHSDYSVDEYTTLLVDQEWEERQSRKMNRLIQAAKFKVNATMSEIDYKANRGLDRDMISRLALLSFVKQRQNVIEVETLSKAEIRLHVAIRKMMLDYAQIHRSIHLHYGSS